MAHASSAVDKIETGAVEVPTSNGAERPASRLADDPFVALYHELRAPLGLIVTTALGAASECAEGSATRDRLERISRVAERTLRVTETVLALARSDVDSPSGAAFRPAGALSSMVDDLDALGDRVVLLDVQPEAARAQLIGCSAHFEGMVQALLTNAHDHGAADGAIRVTLEVVGDTLCLTVDNPIAAKPTHWGLGIGAYLAGRLAGKLGGTLTSTRSGDEYRAQFRAVIPSELAAAATSGETDAAAESLAR